MLKKRNIHAKCVMFHATENSIKSNFYEERMWSRKIIISQYFNNKAIKNCFYEEKIFSSENIHKKYPHYSLDILLLISFFEKTENRLNDRQFNWMTWIILQMWNEISTSKQWIGSLNQKVNLYLQLKWKCHCGVLPIKADETDKYQFCYDVCNKVCGMSAERYKKSK